MEVDRRPLLREDVLDVLWRRPPQAAALPLLPRQVQGQRSVVRGALSDVKLQVSAKLTNPHGNP